MTQYVALRCAYCHHFQVQREKKEGAKWGCGLCGRKQSVLKVVSRSAKPADLRVVVQRLNMQRAEQECTVQAPRLEWSGHVAPPRGTGYGSGHGYIGGEESTAGAGEWSYDDAEGVWSADDYTHASIEDRDGAPPAFLDCSDAPRIDATTDGRSAGLPRAALRSPTPPPLDEDCGTDWGSWGEPLPPPKRRRGEGPRLDRVQEP
eukprot:Hpha_TRINITY_DN5192_c0_g1::TRINITY_DN5192_c0_g1_i1::g.193072::m.193072